MVTLSSMFIHQSMFIEYVFVSENYKQNVIQYQKLCFQCVITLQKQTRLYLFLIVSTANNI